VVIENYQNFLKFLVLLLNYSIIPNLINFIKLVKSYGYKDLEWEYCIDQEKIYTCINCYFWM